VITTVNVQHLESLNDVVERITGVVQRETVPDAIVRGADQIELVDMSPEALAGAWPTATSIRPSGSTPRWPTTSGRATSARCGSWPSLWVADRVEESLQG
jgi:two-component system sensor histidine kinase KdpD